MIRTLLDGLYDVSAFLACTFFAGIGVCIVLQVVTRIVGFHVAGLVDYATYAMVASMFFGLAYALKRDAHIRVTLLLGASDGALRRALELVSLVVGAAVLVYFSYHATQLALDSWRFGMRDLGLAATPLWIPQAGMAIGAAIGALAFVDELILVARGRPPTYDRFVAGGDGVRAAAGPIEPPRNGIGGE